MYGTDRSNQRYTNVGSAYGTGKRAGGFGTRQSIIDDCWVAVGTKKPHAIQRDFTRMFNGKPSYRFELKEDDNTLSGYAKGETKGRAEFSYCYATSDDFKGLPADVYQKAQITKTVYHHGKGICPQGASRDYEFSVYIPSALDSNVSTILPNGTVCPTVRLCRLLKVK